MLRRITFVLFSLRGGGAERIVANFASVLSKRFEVTIIQLSDHESFYELPQGVHLASYRGIASGFRRFPTLAIYLRRELSRFKPDVIISFGENVNPFVLAVAKLGGHKVVVSNRASPYSSLRGRRGWLNPLLYPIADAVWVQTQRAVEVLAQRYRGCRWWVIENPIDFPEHVPEDSERQNICVTVGHLGGQKNQAVTIRAFAKVAPADWALWIVGDGPEKARLEELSTSLGISDRIIFMGAVTNVYAVLQQAKIFLSASRSEGFPNALAEAMAFGCACVAYDCPTGPAELIDSDQSGLLVELDDRNEFERALEKLIESDGLRTQIGKAARADISRLAIKNVAGDLIQKLESVVIGAPYKRRSQND